MEHFANRPSQAQQQHIYGTSPYNIYSSQPAAAYLTGPYQAVPQHQITFQQGPSQYSRPAVANAVPISTNVQQRRTINDVSVGVGGINGLTRSTGVHQGGVPSGSIAAHHTVQPTGHIQNDGCHGIASLTAPLTQHHRLSPSQDMPLRIVVDAKYVGAIIGQGGSNIREITKDSKARCVVDSQRVIRDSSGNAEKVISILGQPESCSRACIKILEVIMKEMERDNSIVHHSEIELKIRAHNQLVGRLIGKGGATIKKIMEETGAHIYVSNDPAFARDAVGAGSMTCFNSFSAYAEDTGMHVERTVTVKAPDMNTVSAAEQRISQKLRQSYETDFNARVVYAQSGAGGAVSFMTSVSGETGYRSTANTVSPAHYVRSSTIGATPSAPAQYQFRTVNMWVPNNMVGALIGAKGVHIRNAMRFTGAQLRIEGGGATAKEAKKLDSKDKEDKVQEPSANDAKKDVVEGDAPPVAIENNKHDNNGTGDERPNETSDHDQQQPEKDAKVPPPKQQRERENHADERLVTIIGNDPQQHKAQFWIYQRIAEQSCHCMDEVRLCTEVNVPSKLVGRIIGKGGQNVRELQRMTGAQVKIPDDTGEDESQKSTIVRVVGNFQSSSAVQARLGQLINDFSRSLTIGYANGQIAPNTQGSSPGAQESQW